MLFEKYIGTGGCLAGVRVRVSNFDSCPAGRFWQMAYYFWQTAFSRLPFDFIPCDYRGILAVCF